MFPSRRPDLSRIFVHVIVGTGIDLIAVARIARFRTRWRQSGLQRLFTAAELDYCDSLAHPEPSLAARFAAKEAFFKAIGTGFGRGGGWRDVEVVRAPSGRPRLRLRGRAAGLARRRGVRRIHVSLSHSSEHAIAHVLLER